MTYPLLAGVWATLLAMAYVETRRRSPALLFALALLIAAGVPATIYLFGDAYGAAVVEQAVLYIILFNLLYLVTRLLLPGPAVVPDPSERQGPPAPSRAERRLVLLVGAVFALAFVLKLADSGFSLDRLLNSSWRENLTVTYVLILYCAHASFGIVLCLFIWRRYPLALLSLVAAVVLVVLDRRRVMGLGAVAPLLLYMIFWSLRGRRRFGKIALTVTAGGLALLGFYVVQQIRYFGPLTAAASAEPGFVFRAALLHITSLQGDLSLLEPFLWMIDNGHYVDGFGELVTVRRMLLFWLPSGFKPPEFTHSIAAAIRGGGEGASLHPTIYGLSWGEALWFGVLYAPFLAVVFRVLDGLLVRFRGALTWALLMGPYTVFAVTAARGNMQTAWVVMIVTMGGLFALRAMSRAAGGGPTYLQPLPHGPPIRNARAAD
ncbi:MAG TPA: hypothetical protein VK837_00835 [Longimicrobiales bacterium]|nr:hypothetical protein [Longimicrobiales bacterium]